MDAMKYPIKKISNQKKLSNKKNQKKNNQKKRMISVNIIRILEYDEKKKYIYLKVREEIKT